jgi:hypothetical protein
MPLPARLPRADAPAPALCARPRTLIEFTRLHARRFRGKAVPGAQPRARCQTRGGTRRPSAGRRRARKYPFRAEPGLPS